MEKELIFNREYLRLHRLKDHPVLYAEWLVMTTFDKMKEGSLAYATMMEQYDLHYAIADLTQVKGNFSFLNQWLRDEWAPRVKQAGMRAMTMVPSADVFTQYSVEQLNRRYERGARLFKFRITMTVEEAYDWILQEQAQNAK